MVLLQYLGAILLLVFVKEAVVMPLAVKIVFCVLLGVYTCLALIDSIFIFYIMAADIARIKGRLGVVAHTNSASYDELLMAGVSIEVATSVLKLCVVLFAATASAWRSRKSWSKWSKVSLMRPGDGVRAFRRIVSVHNF
jgi:hypothetical protein